MLHKRKENPDDLYMLFGNTGGIRNVCDSDENTPRNATARDDEGHQYGSFAGKSIYNEHRSKSKSGKNTKDSAKKSLTDGSKNSPGNLHIYMTLAFPYFRESTSGRWLFVSIVLLALLNGSVNVVFSYLNRDFWNAMENKDVDEFYRILEKFMGACLLLAPIKVIYWYQLEKLVIKWRQWMTDRLLQLYQSNRVYYSLERDCDIDNPDQRISQDILTFTRQSLSLFKDSLSALIDLVSFSLILYSIRPQLFISIFLFAGSGTFVTYLIGRKLIQLNFQNLQKEADFRYSLVRLRDNSESIAFYGGEDIEGKEVNHRLNIVIGNMIEINIARRNLNVFTTLYDWTTWIVPLVVIAPDFFAGKVAMGQVSQASSAFSHVLSDLSIFVEQFGELSVFLAGIDRLHQFIYSMREVDPARNKSYHLMDLPSEINDTSQETGAGLISENQIIVCQKKQTAMSSNMNKMHNHALVIENLVLFTPDMKRNLIENLTISTTWDQNLLITGASGCGKSSLLRAIAGLWKSGSGIIERPSDGDIYFLPQRPYCSLGTLRDQLLYPCTQLMSSVDFPKGHRLSRAHLLAKQINESELLNILDSVDLPNLARRAGDGDAYRGLDTVLDWSNTLSLGEQQRLAFGRVLVNRPRMVILDESTSALDVLAEQRMYGLLKEMRKGSSNFSYVSVGHRPSLMEHHDVRLHISNEKDFTFKSIDVKTDDIVN